MTADRSSGSLVYQLSRGPANLILVLLPGTSAGRILRAEVKAEPKVITYHLLGPASIFPQCDQPGTRTKVKILGEYVDRAHVVVPNDLATRGRARLQLHEARSRARGERPRRVWRASFPHHDAGSSNVLLFRVGNLRHRASTRPTVPSSKWKKSRCRLTIVFLSSSKGTKGHPPNHQIMLHRIAASGKQAANQKITILENSSAGRAISNVSARSPDSKRFAYISYMLAEEAAR